MATIQFPASPATGETVVRNGVAYTWNGSFWEGNVQNSEFDDRYVEKAGDDMSGNLTLGTDKIELDATDGDATFKGKVDIDSSITAAGVAQVNELRAKPGAKNNWGIRAYDDTDVKRFGVTGAGSTVGFEEDGSTNAWALNHLNNRFSHTVKIGNDIADQSSNTPTIELNEDGTGIFKGDVAVGDSSSSFRTIAAVIAALPESIRSRFADALATWETAGTLDLEDPTTLPAEDELREAIIRATTAGKINLNGDTGIITAGSIGLGATDVVNSPAVIQNNSGVNGAVYARNMDPSGPVFQAFGPNSNTAQVASINSDGSITAAAGITTDSYLYSKNSDPDSWGCYLYDAVISGSRNAGAALIVSTSTSVADKTCEISYDGSITAAGSGTFGDTSNFTKINNVGTTVNLATGNLINTVAAFRVQKTGTATANDIKATIFGDGSISAAGTITVGTYDNTLNKDGVRLGSLGGVFSQRNTGFSASTSVFAGYYGSTKTFDVAADGTVIVGGDAVDGNNAGITCTKAGNLAACRDLGTKAVFSGYTLGDTNPKIALYANGNATFAGNVTAPNVTFNLEPDNEANYEVSTETYTETEYIEVPVVNKPGTGTADIQDGVSTADLVSEPETQTVAREVEKTREIRTYVGPTLSVRDELVALRDRAAAQDEVIAQLSARLAAMEGNGTPAPATRSATKKADANQSPDAAQAKKNRKGISDNLS